MAASGAAGEKIAVGRKLSSDRSELMTNVKFIIPNAINRVHFSYLFSHHLAMWRSRYACHIMFSS